MRRCRQTLFREAAPIWRGTREGLRRAVREALKPLRRNMAALMRLARDVRFAALLAGAVVAGAMEAGSGAAWASPPIELSDISMDANAGGFVINGIDADDNSGRSVSAAGDVNGDGLADLLVAARYADPGGDSSAGESYVVFGKTGGTAIELSAVAAGTGGFVVNGIDQSDFSGRSVAGAGDVNGDGLADIIIGTHRIDEHSGRAYVVFGKADGEDVQLSEVANGTGGFAVIAESTHDRVAASLASAGDMNGDGLDDVIIGALFAGPHEVLTDNGRGYVVFGKMDGAQVLLVDVAAGVGGFALVSLQFRIEG